MKKFRSFWPKKQKNNPKTSGAGQGRPAGSENLSAPPAGQARPGRHKKSSRRILAAIFAILLLLIIWGISALAGSLIKVRSVEVIGSSPYSDEEIISYTGIAAGSRVNKIDRRGLERDLLRKYTYLREAEIKTGLFGKVRIIVSADTAEYYTEIAGDYYALSPDFRLLELGGSSDFESAGLIFISLPKIKSAILGDKIVFYDSDSGFVAELMDELKNSELYPGIQKVNAADRYAINLICERYKVKIGAYKDITLKLKIASQMAKDDVLDGDVKAVLDVSDPKNAIIRFE
ncbi:MAG: hypothetical protein GX057_02860 [Clostridiales bacterium]|nr:hypothetical protein [Clostridiales bacterium]